MAKPNIGDIHPVSINIQTLVNRVLTDTDPTTLTLHVRTPDGTYTSSVYLAGGQTYTIVKDSTGDYHADIPITMAGVWWYEWVSTGPGAGAEERAFRVPEQRTRAA